MPQLLKELTLGDFLGSMESRLYNTGTIPVTATTTPVAILAGQPIAATGVVTTAPLGIATESVTIAAGESYNVAALTAGFGVVLNLSILKARYPSQYPAAQTALEAMGFRFSE